MELTWYGRTCIRLKGGTRSSWRTRTSRSSDRPGAASPARSSRSATRTTRRWPRPRARSRATADASCPTSLEDAFVLDGPGEYEVHDVLLTGVRTYRDDARGAERGRQTAFVVELDGMHTIHLGDIGHLLTEEKLGDIGPVDIACVPGRRRAVARPARRS